MKVEKLICALFVLSSMCAQAGLSDADASSNYAKTKRVTGLGDLEFSTAQLSTAGTFTREDQRIVFESKEFADEIYDITVELSGLTLTALIDAQKKVAILDGYATGTSFDTHITKGDRALLMAFNTDVFESMSDVNAAGEQLQHVVSIWAEYPITLELTLPVFDQETLSYESLCGSMGKPVPATHDDARFNRGEDQSTLDMAYVSPPSWGSCQEADHTWFHIGKNWECIESDHDSDIEKAKGNCFGNCGSGCSGGGLQMTKDCHDYDQCVRNGHHISSAWCNDEFISAVDDELNALNCATVSVTLSPENAQEVADVPETVVNDRSLLKPSWKLNKLEKIVSILVDKIDRTTNELQKALTAKQAILVQKKEISLVRSRMVMRKAAAQINELRSKVESGDEPSSIANESETKRQGVLSRISHITDEVDVLSQRLQNLRREEDRIEEAIRDLNKAQKEVMH